MQWACTVLYSFTEFEHAEYSEYHRDFKALYITEYKAEVWSQVTWLGLKLQIWWLYTQLDKIIKDLQLDLDFNTSDSWLHLDLNRLTWKYLRFKCVLF